MNKKQWILIIILSIIISSFAFAGQSLTPIETIDSWHNQALRLKNEGRYKEAEALFKKILTAEPTNANAQFDLGNLYLCQNRYDEAMGYYNEAVELGLDSKFMSDYHFNFSMCYVGLGKNKEAIYHLEECLKISPERSDAKNLLELVNDAYKRGDKLKIEATNE